MSEHRLTRDGLHLRYLTGGSGPPILLCHGFIGSAENFAGWMPALLPRRTVVAPDIPGFGASRALGGRHDAAALAQAALHVADAAGIDVFDVAGLCLGACVALAVQALAPRRVSRLVLHTPLLAPWLTRRRFHAQTRVMLAPRVYTGIVWLSRRRAVSDLYKRLMVEGGGVDAQAARINFENQLRAEPRAAREWLRDGLRRNDLEQLCTSGRRALVMVAEQDRIVDVPLMRRALRGLPHVELAVLEEGGHAWTRSMIERQQSLLAAFLDDQPLPSAGAGAQAA